MAESASPTSTTTVRSFTGDVDAFAKTEWLLTNGIGGFAMGTALGTPSRRYHGALVASMRPPVQRVMALSQLAETVVLSPGTAAEQRYDLACFRFRPGELHPRGDQHLLRFEKDRTVRWVYKCGAVEVEKELALVHGRNAVAVRYTLRGSGQPVRLTVRPLVALRDFHSLILRDTNREWFRVERPGAGEADARRCAVQSPAGTLFMATDAGAFTPEEQWWYNFQYDMERERGYDYLEDLFHPGAFVADLRAQPAAAAASDQSLTLWATTDPQGRGGEPRLDVAALRKTQQARVHKLIERTRERSGLAAGNSAGTALDKLVAASDDFVVRRLVPPSKAGGAGQSGASTGAGGGLDRVTVIAGYPWFADWGRDAMISLPGLLLATGRLDEARDVLRTFAGACSGGLVPNLFDDYTGQAQYNTVDASLWFVHAACEYLRAGGDAAFFKAELLPACMEIITAYSRGTSFGIRADEDGLIAAGDPSTQLTWMDAKRDGVVFTPRHGKAVEINALWHHVLVALAQCGQLDRAESARLTAEGNRVKLAFVAAFWNGPRSCLFDCLVPGARGWEPASEVRPNQILAVSLRNSPLTRHQQAGVLEAVLSQLVTPNAVRTLEPGDARYRGRYRGRMFERDAAYHNGTAWPWLLGPVAEAILRHGEFSQNARERARELLRPIVARLDGECVGQLPEVFDGDDELLAPQQPGGCPAQAWSVAEVLRVLLLIDRGPDK